MQIRFKSSTPRIRIHLAGRRVEVEAAVVEVKAKSLDGGTELKGSKQRQVYYEYASRRCESFLGSNLKILKYPASVVARP